MGLHLIQNTWGKGEYVQVKMTTGGKNHRIIESQNGLGWEGP